MITVARAMLAAPASGWTAPPSPARSTRSTAVGPAVEPCSRLHTLAGVIEYLGASGQSPIIDATEVPSVAPRPAWTAATACIRRAR